VLLDVDFSLGRGLRKSFPLLSSSSSSLSLRASLPYPPITLPLPVTAPLGRVARSATALPIGADTPRGVEADFSLLASVELGRFRPLPSVPLSVRPSAGHPPPRSLPVVSSVELIEAACVRACTSCCSVQSFPCDRRFFVFTIYLVSLFCSSQRPRKHCDKQVSLGRPQSWISISEHVSS